MKKIFFLITVFVLAFAAGTMAQSDAFYPYYYQTGTAKTWAVDTSSNTETTTYLLPKYLDEEFGGEKVTWQVSMANISDTSTVTIYVQQSLDPAAESTARWVNTDTIVTTVQMIASGTKDYLYVSESKGLRMRLQLVYTGTGTAKVRTRVWAKIARAPRFLRV